jgi:hypothetical protein
MNPDNPILRVSVANLARVLFSNPEDGNLMLALERQATVRRDGEVTVKAQPFGGGVHILDPEPLKAILGELTFDSVHSQMEADFRLLIPASKWEAVKEFCLAHLAEFDDPYLESTPERELSEEFSEAVRVDLRTDQYTIRRVGFVIEEPATPTLHIHAGGWPTARIYTLFEVMITDAGLVRQIQDVNRRYPDHDLMSRARKDHLNHGMGWINSVLTLPVGLVTREYLRLPKDNRFQMVNIENQWLDISTVAILPEVEVDQYQRST